MSDKVVTGIWSGAFLVTEIVEAGVEQNFKITREL